jgi:hypothetical protein
VETTTAAGNVMAKPASPKQHRPAEPLLTRQVFLDTQVYRGLGHNPENLALTTLKEQIDAHRIVLHTTDITLLEVRRQIREQVLARQRELGGIEKDLRRWRKQASKSAPPPPLELDVEPLAAELFKEFREFLVIQCGAEVHKALEIPPAIIFTKYFERCAPFDGEDSKEFPDAFVLEALARWAETHDDKIHVVTKDKAMTRAAEADQFLLPLDNIHEVLTRAAADLGPEAEAEAEELLNRAAFDKSLQLMLEPQMKDATYIYAGSLAEGEAYGGELLEIVGVGDWSVVSLNAARISLILDVTVKVLVEIQYEDRDSATYDREDDVWFGTEDVSLKVDEDVDVEVLIEMTRDWGDVVSAKVLTYEIEISGPSDYDY